MTSTADAFTTGAVVVGCGDVAEECYPDCDGSGTVDTGDFACFLGKWAAAISDPATCGGDPDCYADCDGSGTVDTGDFACFLGLWASAVSNPPCG